MKDRSLCLLMLMALVSGLVQAQAQQEAKVYSITAISLSRAVISGIRIGAEVALRDGKITADNFACYASLDETSFAPLYDSKMREAMSAEDIQTLDNFYGSEAGRRYYRWTFNQLRSQQKLPIKEPIEMSAEEIKRAEDFHATGPGLVLVRLTSADGEFSKQLDVAIQKVLEPCR